MRIMHVSPFKLGTQHGLYNAVWALARAQALSGHRVVIVRAGKLPSHNDIRTAREAGVALDGCPFHRWFGFWRDEGCFKQLLDKYKPDIVHFQYVRMPKYYAFAKILRKQKLPYVVSLHGGMDSVEMKRRRMAKLAYWFLVEREIHYNASGFHFVSSQEKEDYYKNFMQGEFEDAVIPNPVYVPQLIPSWRGPVNAATPRFVFLGRYDIWTKGLDLVAEMLRFLQEKFDVKAELHLYGSPGERFVEEFEKLRRKYADVPMIDHGLVHGSEKYKEMLKYDFYIQYSRFEVFGMSIAEALWLGMPVIVSENCDLANELSQVGGAIIIPMDPQRAASIVFRLLNDTTAIESVRRKGREWIRSCCAPRSIAERMVAFYQRAMKVK